MTGTDKMEGAAMPEYTIRDLQNAGYYLLNKLQDICEATGIKAVLGYGTLLGAIRHNGFIPWDDDVDVCMTVKDFKKLEKHFKKTDWWIDDVFLDTVNTDRETRHCLPRLRLDNSFVTEIEVDGINMNKCLWLDIFVFCDAAKNPLLLKTQLYLRNKVFLLHEKYLNRQKRRNGEDIISTQFFYRLAEALPDFWRVKLINLLFKVICALGSKKSCQVINLCMYGIHTVTPNYLSETTKHRFETGSFEIPERYDDYLKLYYGNDYMTPKQGHFHFQMDKVLLPKMDKKLT